MATDDQKMKNKPYVKELRKLQVELCHLQKWVTSKGLRVIVLFEGRDAAGRRHHQGPHRKSQPARVSNHRSPRSF